MEGYTLFYAPSASSLPFILGKRHLQADTLLVLANPDTPGAPHLQHAAAEAQAVAALYGTQPFLGPEAGEERFKAQAGQYALVHVAAHSDYRRPAPSFPPSCWLPPGRRMAGWRPTKCWTWTCPTPTWWC